MRKLKKLITFILITIFVLSTAGIAAVCSSCCIDMSKLMESGSTVITFNTGDDIDTSEIDRLLDEFDSSDNQDAAIDYTAIKKELSDTSDFSVSAEEEEAFFGNLEEIYDEDTFILARDYLIKFKLLYPSGYFTIIKVTQNLDYSAGYEWFEIFNDDNSFKFGDFDSRYCKDVNIIVHELTHSGSGLFIENFIPEFEGKAFWPNYSYMIDNLLVLVEKDKMLFSKYELYEDIENPDTFDKTYLDRDKATVTVNGEEIKAGDIDLTMILDELNAYTVSEKAAVATEEFISRNNSSTERYGVLKQMSYIEMYLKKCQEEYPGDWEYLIKHKSLAFTIMKLWQEAEKFNAAARDDSRFNFNSTSIYDYVYESGNYNIIEMFYEESGMAEYRNKDFEDIGSEFDNLKVYNINES